MSKTDISSAELTAAPVELKAGERTYLMHPLTEKDFGEFERWVRSLTIQTGRDACEGIEDEEGRQEVLQAAFAAAAKISLSSPECKASMRTVEGVQRLVWYSLRRGDGRLTLEKSREVVNAAGGLGVVSARLNEVMPKAAKGEPSKNEAAAVQ